MVITDFYVASSSDYSNCPSDYVTITDGDGKILMDKSCRSLDVLPKAIMSSTDIVEIFFYTDSNVISRGWSLSWAAVTSGNKIMSETIGCKSKWAS